MLLHEIRSSKSLQEIDIRLRDAASRHQFGVLAVHNLGETMRNKGVDYAGECMIYEICNPHQAKRALDANNAVANALPCRISIYQDGSEYKVSTIPADRDDADVRPGAGCRRGGEVEGEIKAMMAESA